ncbi:MAG: hypothetical protein AB7U83_25370 [Vicinamibacterales bacterium]
MLRRSTTLSLLLLLAASASPAAAQPVPLAIAAAPDAPDWIAPTQVARFALSRPLAAGEGRLAVFVGDTDWSGLAEVAGTSVTLRPTGRGFAPGEHTVTAYLAADGQPWQPLAPVPLRILTPGGFERAVTTPTLEAGLAGQARLERTPEQPPGPRDTYQDLTVRAGFDGTYVRRGWTTSAQATLVGVSERAQALRYGTLLETAPLVDLGSYRLALGHKALSVAVGHTAIGSHRLLLNGFDSRGVNGRLQLGPVLDVSLAAVNGSTLVGYANPFGLADGEHRIVNAGVGLELVPSRPGALRLDGSLMLGSILPVTNVNQGAVRDPEESRGVGVQLQATDPSSRFQLAAGVARSRFVNPRDPQAPLGLSIVEVQETTRWARYLDVSYALVQGARLGGAATASLTAAYRHSRVDPLYRSVALPVRADVEQHAVDVTATLGAVSSQVTLDHSRDNLADIASILTTTSRQLLWTTALPLHTFAGTNPRAAALPTLSYALTRVHQLADDLPAGGLFDAASQAPDQVSLNQTLGVAWQGARWRGGYSWNRSLQDNRQPGRERADLLNLVHTVSLGASAGTRLDGGVDLAFEDAENREVTRTDLTRRISGNLTLRPAARTSLAAVVTRNLLEDEPRSASRRTTDLNLTFTQGIALWPQRPDRLSGQFFVRYVRQTITGVFVGIAGPDDTQFWTLNTGVTFRVF